MSNTAIVVARVLHREGGIKDVGDGKGETRFGQTPAWIETWGFQPPRTEAEAAANYTRWMQKLKLDQLVEIDLELGDGVTDFAVHSGHREAIQALQRLVKVPADGVIGPFTLAAIRSYPAQARLAIRFEAQRLRYIGKLLGSEKVDRREWASGWCNRIADRIDSVVMRG